MNEDKIFTSCFQRDSLKDELVIYLFLIVTTGLLVWAGAKPWVEKLRERSGFGSRATGIGVATGGVGRSYSLEAESTGARQQGNHEEEGHSSM